MYPSIFTRLSSFSQIPPQVADLCENPCVYPKSWEKKDLERASKSTRQSLLADSTTQPKKLLHIASDCLRGGAESVFRNTIEQTQDGFEVFVASCDLLDSLPQGIKPTHFCQLDDWNTYPKILGASKYIFNLKNYRLLKAFLQYAKPDIIHTQNYLSRLSPSVLFALRWYKRQNPYVRLIYTEHGFAPCANGGFYNYTTKSICTHCIGRSKFAIAWKNCDRRGIIHSILKALRLPFYQGIFLDTRKLFDRILFVSKFQLQKHLQDSYENVKLEVVYNPIEMRFYNQNVRLEDKQDLVVFFGRLSPEKNVSLLIRAFAKLVQNPSFASYKLLIIGEGDDKVACENLALELFGACDGLDSKPCSFVGKKPPQDIAQILKNAKLCVMPTKCMETFGLTIVESTIAGCIALVRDIGALNETAQDFGALVFEDCLDGIESLSSAMERILGNYEFFFNEFSKRRHVVLQKLQNNQYLKDLQRVYWTQ